MAVCEGTADLAARHQVLVLTCHPATVDALVEASHAAGHGKPRLVKLSEDARQLSLSGGG